MLRKKVAVSLADVHSWRSSNELKKHQLLRLEMSGLDPFVCDKIQDVIDILVKEPVIWHTMQVRHLVMLGRLASIKSAKERLRSIGCEYTDRQVYDMLGEIAKTHPDLAEHGLSKAVLVSPDFVAEAAKKLRDILREQA